MVPGGGALDAVSAAAAAGVTVVAYGEHVQADVLQAGRDAGADEVLTRSEFTRRWKHYWRTVKHISPE